MMKWYLLFLVLSICNITKAQNTSGAYQLVPGAEVEKQRIVFPEIAEAGQGILWDFREIEPVEEDYIVAYDSAQYCGIDHVIGGTEQHSRYYYRSGNDFISFWGYENKQTKVCYDRPEPILHMPLVYGERYDGQFHGSLTYCERAFMRVFGTCQVEVTGTGSILLPGGDTLRHVSLVHTHKRSAYQQYPHISTEKELKNYVDSIMPFSNDSIRQHLATDSLQSVTDTYRWYAAGYRYPILEAITANFIGEQPQAIAAYYCAPEVQAEIDDEENEEIRRQLASASHSSTSDGDGSANDNTPADSLPLENVDVSVSGKTISVSFDLTSDTTVRALICNVLGVVFKQESQTGHAGEHYQMNVYCGGLSAGNYVLHLQVDGKTVFSNPCNL